jgi:hypothetical protein
LQERKYASIFEPTYFHSLLAEKINLYATQVYRFFLFPIQVQDAKLHGRFEKWVFRDKL